ncbi:hypothetical protein WBG78_05885 [Chryseolinea sp. T2]|uniref:hypothetical protein n=1 Tax=Chryseolinea sp. T2 TaxID=3129255 RepID=UPI003078284E
MKFTTKTRWQYYVANVAGIVGILALLGWSISRSLAGGIDFTSVHLWLAFLMLILLPFPLIGFFSSMKAVDVNTKAIIITYVFQRHSNVISFDDIAEVKSQQSGTGTRKSSFRDTFTLILKDGRAFEFDRSQFDQYDKLRTVCTKAAAKR